jgi:hypothetical protein
VKWLIVSVAVALAAVVAANALLLVYGGNRHDPVGRLSPIAKTRLNLTPQRPAPPVTRTTRHTGQEDD